MIFRLISKVETFQRWGEEKRDTLIVNQGITTRNDTGDNNNNNNKNKSKSKSKSKNNNNNNGGMDENQMCCIPSRQEYKGFLKWAEGERQSKFISSKSFHPFDSPLF